MKAKISEIFKSIQGEGLYQGALQVFVRFFGCNLNCSFCDTKLKYYQEKSLEDITGLIAFYKDYHSISLTGGEPLMQIDFLKELAQILKKMGKKTYLETNGTLPDNLEKVIDEIDIVSMDFKLPSSTGQESFWAAHKDFLKIASEKEVFVKAVIGLNTEEQDILQAIDIIKNVVGADFMSARNNIQFILQPQNPFEVLLKKKLNYFKMICENNQVNVKIMSQLHKELRIM
jgi:organic radical activating enzyme